MPIAFDIEPDALKETHGHLIPSFSFECIKVLPRHSDCFAKSVISKRIGIDKPPHGARAKPQLLRHLFHSEHRVDGVRIT